MEDTIAAWILSKLMRRGYWGRRPMNTDDLPKGAIKEARKEIISTADELANTGFLLRKKGRFGWRYSLNPPRKNEIIEFVREHLVE